MKATDITERSAHGILNRLAGDAPAENLIHAGGSRCVGVADVADGVRPMLSAMEVALHVHGRQSVNELAAALSELDDVDVVLASDVHAIDE